MKILGSLEARMGSTRLPGKTMLEIYGGKPLLACVVERFRRCTAIDGVLVATTTSSMDQPIADWCVANALPCFRGSEDDVLDRVQAAARKHAADAIVQMGADSAYLDHELIDRLVDLYRGGRYDYACSDLQRGYPVGIYGHVVGVAVLARINLQTDLSAADRSDVVRYIWEHPDKFRIHNLPAPDSLRQPELRFTVDYPDDLALARAIYARFGGPNFRTPDLLALHAREPELFAPTKGLQQRSAPFLSAIEKV